MRVADLWRWDGRVSRKTYVLAGLIGVAIKYNLDRFLAIFYFHQATKFVDYWRPLHDAARITNLSQVEMDWLAVMVLTALPFIWIGLSMTVRRLRDAGYPVWLTVLFFLPFGNLLFFLFLSIAPPKSQEQENEARPWAEVRSLEDLIPHSRWGSAFLSIVLTALIGIVGIAGLTLAVGSYGWSLFIALPFCMGLFATLLHSYHEPRSWSDCMKVSLLPIFAVGIALLLVAMEGVICLLMAAPLAIVLAVLGGSLGYRIQANHWGARPAKAMMGIVLLLLPVSAGTEYAIRPVAPVFQVKSSVEVDAPPELVWQKVISFSEIPPPQEMIFRSGIAYPLRAEITGEGPGAVRRCVFSTGPFVEPIEVWEAPRLLRFDVTENPAPMNELSPYGNIRPPHLHGYFVSHQGQFLLTALPNGRTRVEGTTWYSNTLWPAAYWHWWSDSIIHRIHLRVLNHVKQLAEGDTRR